MTPFFFGTGGARLFGIHSPPLGSDRHFGLVMCYPFGDEYYAAYAAFRSLSDRVAARGLHVLRFDYPGTGDSAGEIEDFGADDWLDSVDQAIDELRELAQLDHVALAGLRLGAAMARGAALRRTDVSHLVMWDPADPAVDRPPCPQGLCGRLPARSHALGIRPARTLVVHCAAKRTDLDEVDSGAAGVTVAHRPGPLVWRPDQDWGRRGLPIDAFETMAGWLTA